MEKRQFYIISKLKSRNYVSNNTTCVYIYICQTVTPFRWKNNGEGMDDWKKKIGYRVISLGGHLYKSLVESIEDKGRLDEINASYRCGPRVCPFVVGKKRADE